MNRRLLLLFAAVVAAGIVRLSIYGIARRQLGRTSTTGLTPGGYRIGPWTNPPAPSRPPKAPPPGRPFSRIPVSYQGRPPSAASLRAAVQDANLVICVLDAARADHFGAYGYPRPTTPNFDRLAKQSLLFEQHFTEAPQTGPSTASLLTSQYPDTHGLMANSGGENEVRGISPSAFTLEKALQRAGFRTALYSANVVASPAMGIGADFMISEYRKQGPDREPWDPVARWAGVCLPPPTGQPERSRRGPRRSSHPGDRFFAYLHVLPPHQPYQAPKAMVALFADTRPPTYWQGKFDFPQALTDRPPTAGPDSWVTWGNLYDANLRSADAAVGDLVSTLGASGLLEETLLIVTADHGDAMREHGYSGHLGVPYDEALHIPLLVRFPGAHRPVGRVKALTQTIDLMPTLLDLWGIHYPRTEVQGRSLVPLLAGEVDKVNDFIFSRATLWDASCYVIRDAHTALLLFHGGQPRGLYDLDADPWQTRNIIRQQPARAEALVGAFRAFAEAQRYRPLDFLDPRFTPPKAKDLPTTAISPETQRQLKSMGYVR